MRLSEIGGEFGWIERMRQAHGLTTGAGLTLAIGDDAAILEQEAGRQLVVTTDMLVEGVHFRRDWSDPYSIGWKAAAVNLSDIAAMGAEPTFAFVSLAFPAGETVEFLDRLYDGFVDCLTRYGARLAGGDTNTAPHGLIVNVTQLGTVPTGQALTRRGARVGDRLLVTGTLGDSSAGLALLSQHGLAGAEKISRELVQAHRRPQPRIVAGLAAARTGKVHAAMDISDGLAGDLAKLCAASQVGARVQTALLPLPEALGPLAPNSGGTRPSPCHKNGDPLPRAGEGEDSSFLSPSPASGLSRSAWSEVKRRVGDEGLSGSPEARESLLDFALDGGEDYELLLAVAPADAEAVCMAIAQTGLRATVIGEVVKSGLHFVAPDGRTELPTARRGWDHFRL